MLPWTLARASSRCTARRLRRALRRSPLLAVGLLAAAVVLPPLATIGGARAGSALGGAFAIAWFPAAFAATTLCSGLLLGLMVGALALDFPGIGGQLRLAPMREREFFAALIGLPVAAIAAVASVAVALFLVPFASRLQLASGAGIILLAGAGATAYGAAFVEAIAGALYRKRRALLALTCLALGWIGAAAVAGHDALWGPLGYLSGQNERVAPGARVPVGLAVVLAAGLACWIQLASSRPLARTQARRLRMSLPIPRFASGATFICTAKRLWRRRELRRNVAGATALAAGGGIFVTYSFDAVGGPFALYLAGTLSAFSGTLYPLAGGGLGRRSRWLDVAPLAAATREVATTLAACSLSILATALVCVPIAILVDAPASELLKMLALSLFLTCAAAVAGVITPWQEGRLSEQFGSVATFLALLAVLWLAASRAFDLLVGSGLAPSAATGLILSAGALAALALVALLSRRSELA